ncbi:hypothetical protein JL100_005815 [Skermanella mucosa]|uniref:hypothetical protein n=1 Tax=Skermanella mucosa TaxID=1789672 RepID=UPI00192BBEFD|nr:hypothetical protein [Skermanella mucosa]UEM22267.1 hypothetical protein JL100_005815 [Skermanella mucosa]
MTTVTIEGELRGHVAGALRDYITKLYEHKASTPSKAAKADYDRTIAELQKLLDTVEA